MRHALDGNNCPNEKTFADICNEYFGLTLDFRDNDGELYWMRFNDLISTDIQLQNYSGCIIIVKNAENMLKSAPDGLIRFGSAMNVAGREYANPDTLGLSSDYAPQPKSVHTILCYRKMPKRSPHADLIEF